MSRDMEPGPTWRVVETLDVPLDRLRPNPRQPRRRFRGLDELAASLRARGQLTAVVVRRVDAGAAFELVNGERRWRAAQLAGLATLRADVVDMDDREAFRAGVVENVARDELSAVERGRAFRAMTDDGMTQAEVAALCGVTQPVVSRHVALLDLPAPLLVLLDAGALTEGHVRQLRRLERIHVPGDTPRRVRPGGEVDAVLADPSLGPAAAWYLLHAAQPLEHVPWFPPERLTDHEHAETFGESAVALAEYVTGHDGPVPQWPVTAWFYGVVAAVFGLSVVDLSRAVDEFRDVYASGVLWWSWHGHDAGPEPGTAAETWTEPDDWAAFVRRYLATERDGGHLDAADRGRWDWLYRRSVCWDLKHAGHDPDAASDPPADWTVRHARDVVDRGLTFPSVFQPGGRYGNAWAGTDPADVETDAETDADGGEHAALLDGLAELTAGPNDAGADPFDAAGRFAADVAAAVVTARERLDAASTDTPARSFTLDASDGAAELSARELSIAESMVPAMAAADGTLGDDMRRRIADARAMLDAGDVAGAWPLVDAVVDAARPWLRLAADDTDAET